MYCSKCGQELDSNNVCNNPSCPSNLNPDYNIGNTNLGYTQNINIKYKAPYDNSYTNSSTIQYNNDYSNDFSNQYGDDYYGVFPEEMASFIGYKNTEYYMNKWNTYQFNNNFISWNWPAFLFGYLWCAYRKMYNWMIILFAIEQLESFVVCKLFFRNMTDINSLTSNFILSPIIITVLYLINGILFGLFANQLYIKDCFKKITKIKYSFPSLSVNDIIPRLEKKGGASWIPIIIYFVFCILFAIISYFIYLSFLYNTIMVP